MPKGWECCSQKKGGGGGIVGRDWEARDATYACYEQGFDEAIAKVKHFSSGASVDRERKLDEILMTDAPTSQGVPAMEASHLISFGAKEEEEGGDTPVHYPDLSWLYFDSHHFFYHYVSAIQPSKLMKRSLLYILC